MKPFELFKYFKPSISLLLISNLYFTSYGSLSYKEILLTSGS